MKNSNKNKFKSKGVVPFIITSGIMLLAVIALKIFSPFIMYPSLKILALLIFQPIIISLILLIPPENKEVNFEKKVVLLDKEEKPTFKTKMIFVFKWISAKFQNLFHKGYQFFMAKRVNFVISFCALAFLGINLFFFLKCKTYVPHNVTILVPVILGLIFVVFLILDICCKYSKKDIPSDSRYIVLFENLHDTLKTVKFLFLASTVISVMKLLGFWDLHKILFYILYGFFILQSVSIAFLYTVRIIKKELNTNPDIRLRLFGRKKEELNIIEYLEKNAGITMRSLWSISLIKKTIPYAVMLCAVILWLSTGIVQIGSNQKGALYRLGKLKEDSLEPGIHLTLPYPFDSVDVYDTESLKEITIGYASNDSTDNLWTKHHGANEYKLLLGGGNELVSINLRIEYKISDLSKYLKCSNSPESLLESAAYEAITAKTISSNLENLLTTDRVAFSKSFEKELVKYISPYDTGLEIVGVVLESIHPPVEVADIYQKIISAGIDADKIVIQAEAKAALEIEKAQTSYDKNVNDATAKSHKDIAEAEASVAEFMASLKADEAYGNDYKYFKYLDALKRAYSNAKIIIVGDGIDGSSLYFGSLS